MIAINPILAAASQAGKGKPIFYITLYSYAVGVWTSLGSFDCLSAVLTRLRITITVQNNLVGSPYIVTTCGVPYAITVTRGLTVAGTDYTITTRKYFVSSASYLANEGYTELFADLLPNVAVMNIAADTLAGTVLGNALTSGLVTDYAQDLTRDIWYGWKFDATGEVLNLYDARSISSLLASKYLAYLFPRAGGLYAWNVASNFENPEDGNYTPFSHAKIKKVLVSDKFYNLAWVSETGKQYMTRAPEYPYHALGFISDVDTPLNYDQFVEWGQVFTRATYEIEQRPDFTLEQGDLVKLSLDGFGLIRCLELKEYFKRGKDARWVQIITQFPYHPSAGTTAGPKSIGDYPDNPAPKPSASNILLHTGRFTQLLSKADSDVQEALDTIDNLAYYLKMADGGVIGQPAGPEIKFDDANNALIFNEDSLDVDFRVESDTRVNALFVDGASGDIGINTNTPNFKGDAFPTLSISGQGTLELSRNTAADEAAVGVLHFVKENNLTTYALQRAIALIIGYTQGTSTDAGGHLAFRTKEDGAGVAAVERMRIVHGGFVGIGTPDPNTQVEVSGSSTNTTIGDNTFAALSVRNKSWDALNYLTEILFAFGPASYGPGAAISASYKSWVSGATLLGADLIFSTTPASVAHVNPLERIRIKFDGKVGINDPAPAEVLDVNGNINCTGVYKVDDVQVVGNQGAAVANATDAATTMARLNDLLARLRTHGLIAT